MFTHNENCKYLRSVKVVVFNFVMFPLLLKEALALPASLPLFTLYARIYICSCAHSAKRARDDRVPCIQLFTVKKQSICLLKQEAKTRI